MEVTGLFSDIPVVDQESNTRTSAANDASKLKLDFLKLLMAQLQYQDPLEPTSNTEFTSQMAQFSSLDAQQRSNVLLEQLLTSQGSSQMNQAVSFINKMVVVEGNHTEVVSGETTVRFQMPEEGQATVHLYNEYGELVMTTEPAFFSAGEKRATLAGVDMSGVTLPDGTYTFTVHRTDSTGASVAVATLEAGEVTGVINDGASISLDLGGRLVPMDTVRRVEQGIAPVRQGGQNIATASQAGQESGTASQTEQGAGQGSDEASLAGQGSDETSQAGQDSNPLSQIAQGIGDTLSQVAQEIT